MNVVQAVTLGVVEGITEFLPVSSTGHLTVAESAMGLSINDAGVTAFTAIIQSGAIVAVVVYFRTDIARLVHALWRGLGDASQRRSVDFRLACYVTVGSIPIGVVGFAARDFIAGPLRNLWLVVLALLGWSVVMAWSEKVATQRRDEEALGARDAAVVGLTQCLALVPGVSRSGATISAGLFRGLNRVTATRLSFFLSIPALVAASVFEVFDAADAIGAGVGWTATLVASVVSFAVAYLCIAWLLRLVAKHPISIFIYYRVAAAVVLGALLLVGAVSPT